MLAGLLGALTGCATGSADAAERTLTVYAAASLQNAFGEIAARFEDENPGIAVRPLVYDGSSTLATQLIEGAAADVFASADEATMARVADAGLLAGAPETFATNSLVIVTPARDGDRVRTLADLADPTLAVVLCAPDVPCGSASARLLAAAGVRVEPASREQSVTAVLTKVAAGEADAGLVYRTDAAGRADVRTIVPDRAAEIVNRYPIGVLADSAHPDDAAAFASFVVGPTGRAVLAAEGFGSP